MKANTLLLGAAALLLTSAAFGQTYSNSGPGNATADVYVNISVTSTAALNFADVFPGGSGGTVVVSPAGAASYTGSVTGNTALHPVQAATFQVSGKNGAAYTIASTAGGVMTDAAGQNPMNVTTLTTSVAAGTLDGTGHATFTVGATLNVGANQPQGHYSTQSGGTAAPLSVTVAYN